MPGTGRKFTVSLVTPDGPAYEGDVEMVIVPGADGEIGVLARTPLIATLKAGSTRIHAEEGADVLEFATGPASSGCSRIVRSPSSTMPSTRGDRRRGVRASSSTRRAPRLAAIERGDSTADRWQIEQRVRTPRAS